MASLFQLTAPLREPTRQQRPFAARLDVSTHGSLAGADSVILYRSNTSSVSTHGSLAGADLDGY